jgi:hypothetical protein
MAQINLLKQKTSSSVQWSVAAKIFARFLVLALVALVGYYAWLFFSINQLDAKILSVQQQINKDKEAAFNNKERDQLFTRQQQLQALDKLVASHLYWSSFLPDLAKLTFNKASYSSLQATSKGSLTIAATLPSLQDLDKYLQVFDIPEVNANFYDVKIGSFHEVPQGNTTVIKLDVQMTFDPTLLGYKKLLNNPNKN